MKQNKNKNDVKFRIGVDIGGTFTDATLVNSKTGETFTSKVISTPSDPSVGFINALKKLLDDKHIDPDKLDYVFHATTVATNAIIEGKTASTAFVTTKGFRDMLEIARQIRPSLYDLQFEKPPPLIPRQLCFEVEERVNAKGEIIKTLDGKSIDKVINSQKSSDKKLLFVCASGYRSGLACEMAAAMGVDTTKLFNVDGGTQGWIENGHPTNSGPNP